MSHERNLTLDERAIIWSAKREELAERPLLVLLHGVGSNESDLFSMSPALPLTPVIASLRAFDPHGPGWSWYPLDTPGRPRSEDVDDAAVAILRWLDSLDPQPVRVALLGFSQGAAVALQTLRHAPDRFDFVVQIAGYVTDGDAPGDERLRELRPPVFWGRGTADYVIPPAAVAYTDEWLPRHSTLDRRVYEDLPHAVSQTELADIVGFMRRHYS